MIYEGLLIDKSEDKVIIIKSIIIAFLLLLGVNIPIFTVMALLLASVFILFGGFKQSLGILFFTLAFSPIFKLKPTGFTFFNILLLVFIVKLILENYRLRINYKEIFALLVFSIFCLLFGGAESLNRLINILMGFILILFVLKNQTKVNLKSLLVFFSWGILISSIAALLIDYIPGLNAFTKEISLKLEQGEYIGRFSGLQSNPNFYTMDISIALSVWFGLAIYNQLKFHDYIYIVLLIAFGVMSLSKSFFLILVFLILFVFFNLARRHFIGFIKGAFLFGIIITLIFLFLDSSYINAMINRFIIYDSNEMSISSFTTGRSDLWLNYVSHIFNNSYVFLFGEGLGAGNLNGRASHNYLLEILYHLGILGGILYITCLFNILQRRKNIKRSLVNFLPFFTLLARGMAINLIFRENLPFYFIIIAIALNTNFTLMKSK